MNDTPYLTPGVEDAAPGLMQRATAILPLVRPIARFVPKNPVILAGAAAVGLVAFLAWRNRERIAATARPLLQDAAERGRALKERIPGLRHGEGETPVGVH